MRYVFDTHYHGDHAFGNSVFVDAGATIVCSEECVAESKRKNGNSWAKAAAASPADFQGARLEHPQVGFRDKLVFDDGQHRVELIRVGPGHTAGDAVAYLPKKRSCSPATCASISRATTSPTRMPIPTTGFARWTLWASGTSCA